VFLDLDKTFNSPEGRKVTGILARYGGFNPRMMSKFSDVLVDTLARIPLVKYPAGAMEAWRKKVFGYGGIDHQLRVAVAAVARDVYMRESGEEPPPNWLVEFVNNRMGNYFAQMQPRITRFLIESGLDPFAANHVAIIPSEIMDYVGKNGLPNNKGWNRLKVLLATVVGAGVALAIMNRVLGGHWPWENPPGLETSVSLDNFVPPTQSETMEDQHAYVPPTLLFPEMARTLRITGVHDLVTDLRLGIPGQIGRDAMRDPTNQILSMTLGGAPYQSLWILATGTVPWLNPYGKLATYGEPAKTLGGFVPARIEAMLASTTPIAEKLYHGTSAYGTGKVAVLNKLISLLVPGMTQINEIELASRGEKFIYGMYAESTRSVAYQAMREPLLDRGKFINDELKGYPEPDRPVVAAMIADNIGKLYLGGAYRIAANNMQNGADYQRVSPADYVKCITMMRYATAIRALSNESEQLKYDKKISKDQILKQRDELARQASLLLLQAINQAGSLPIEPPQHDVPTPGAPPVEMLAVPGIPPQ